MFFRLCWQPISGQPGFIIGRWFIKRGDLADRPIFPVNHVDYGEAIQWKIKILDRAYTHFANQKNKQLLQEYTEFKAEQSFWLEDFTLFMAIKDSYGGVSWDNWPTGLRQRKGDAISSFRKNDPEKIDRHSFRQFLFFRQWRNLKEYANQKEIKIIGDIPIFVAYDSADAWSNPELFYLDADGKPTVVAGVPPDYFSPTGQLWGNPLYKWDAHEKQGFAWWIQRMSATLKMVDIVRMDHFRGFAGYWEIPFGMPTAEVGRWVKGPGPKLFDAIHQALGELPVIAEDLGVITPDVIELRDRFALPGMKVFQFAFSTTPNDPFLPHNYTENCVAYTGTHDNDTALGWYLSAPEEERDFIRRYVARSGEDVSWDMIRAVWSSVAVFSLAPMQDVLALGNEARMNLPGRASGNWTWRMNADFFNKTLQERLKEANFLYSRMDIPAEDDFDQVPANYVLHVVGEDTSK